MNTMNILIIGFGILLFAFVTAILVLWGMRKAYFQRETLMNMLLSKAADRVMHYLKEHDTISELQMRKLVEGIKASEFHSRQRAVVQSDPAFTAQLIQVMIHDGLIEPVKEGKSVYRKKYKK